MSGTAYQTLINGSPTNGANPWLDGLVWGARWKSGATGATQLAYATQSGIDPYYILEGATLAWSASEQAMVNSALTAWSNVANLKFTKTTPANADFWVWKGTELQNNGNYGSSDVPDTSVDEPLYTVFNGEIGAWSQAGLAKGGMGYVTLLHEFGHLLGLAHPHDGGSDGDLFPGVTEPFRDYGDYNLNQGIWTTMSYNDGWRTQFPTHTAGIYSYGWQATPMALDIAAVQHIYGKNTTVNTGGNIYLLPGQNGAGTYWSCIWDCGGIDTISNENSNIGSTINLNAAPLTGPNAGGYVSWATNIIGGYTIANGVVIENAVGGNGNDKLVGNAASNTLTGGRGNDTLDGGTGNDSMVGGLGNDIYSVRDTGDVVTEADSAGADSVNSYLASYTIGTNIENGRIMGAGVATLTGNSLNNTLYAGAGNNLLKGAGGTDTLSYAYGLSSTSSVGVTVSLASTAAQSTGGSGSDTVSGFENLTGSSKNDTLTGSSASNVLNGGNGNDILTGGGGKDTLTGGAGNDIFDFNALSDTGATNTTWDVITDFVRGQDKLDLSTLDANSATTTNEAFSSTLITATASFTRAGQLKLVSGVLYGNTDADTAVEFAIQLTGITALSTADFIL